MSAVAASLAGWVLFTGLVAAVGATTARWFIIPRTAADPEARDAFLIPAAHLGFVGAVLLPVGLGLVFHRQLLEFRDPFVAWTEDAALLLNGTEWGRNWKIASALSGFLLLAGGAAALGRKAGWTAAAPLALALAAYPALSGHASGGDAPTVLTIPADVVHVLAAGAWIGGLAFVLLADRRRPDELPRLVEAFSRVAVVSVAALLLTGVVGAWAHLDGPGALVGTTYGRLLTGKVALALTVMALGARNWKHHTPRLGEPGGPAALRRSAMIELALAQIVLIVTAVLVRTSPLAH